MTTRLTHQDWQELLAAEFFSGRLAGRSYFFDLSEERLRALSESQGNPRGLDSLVDAASTYLGNESGNGIFDSPTLKRRVTDWKSQFDRHRAAASTGGDSNDPDPGPPPVLPVLLMTVSAAHRMHHSEESAAHNYYRRFRELVQLPGSGTPRGFDKLSRWWRYLDEWVSHRGLSPGTDVGHLLLAEEPQPAHVGYPISQARWRDSDTDKVLERMSVTSDELSRINDAELITRARRAATVAGLTETARDFIMDAANAAVICRLLRQATPGGQAPGQTALLRLRLYLQPVPPTLAFVAARPDSWPGAIELVDDDGKHLRLEALPADKSTYLSRGLSIDSDVLLHGAEFRSRGARVVFDPDESYTLERHGLGGFVQSPRPHGDVIALLVRDDAPVLHSLDQAEAISGQGIPPGWVAALDVPPNLLETTEGSPTSQAGLTLSGGLRPGPARNMYLTVGLPNVVTSSPLTIRDRDNQVTQVLPRQDGHAELPDLAPGVYELVAGEHSETLRVVESLASHSPPGDRQWRTLDDIEVSGAVVSPPPSRQREIPLSAHASDRVVVGATVGDIVRPDSQRPPAWVRRARLELQEFPYEPPFAPVFVICRFTATRPRVEVENQIPVATPSSAISEPARSDWAEAVLEAIEAVDDEFDPEMLTGYRDVAHQVLAGAS